MNKVSLSEIPRLSETDIYTREFSHPIDCSIDSRDFQWRTRAETKGSAIPFPSTLLFISSFFPCFSRDSSNNSYSYFKNMQIQISLANTCNLQIENYLNITINSRRIAIIRNMNIFLERKILPISFFFIIFLYFYIFRNTLYHCCLNIVIILQYFYCQYLQSNCYASLNK